MRFALLNGHRPTGAAAVPFGSGLRLTVLLTLAILSLASTGCTVFRGVRDYLDYSDGANDFVLGWRNSVWANQAWHERRHLYVDQPQFGAFGAGFRAGYADVAGGGNGCPPPLPPRKYWSWQYQTPEGQAKVTAWFSGYPHGARAAEEEQAGQFQNIQVSYLIEQQYSPEFQNGEMLDLDGSQSRAAEGFPVEPYSDPNLDPNLLNAPAEIYQDTRRSSRQSGGGWDNPALSRLPELRASGNRQVSTVTPVSHLSETESNGVRQGAWPRE